MGSYVLVIGGVDDPAILETIACREALALAQDLNLHQLVIASDSKGVVGAINMGANGGNGAIISEINSLAAFLLFVILLLRVVPQTSRHIV